MKVGGIAQRTIDALSDRSGVSVVDQTRLPHKFARMQLASADDCAHAIRTMIVRGAPLIGVTAAYGLALALRADARDAALERAAAMLLATRPTAVNLRWAIERVRMRVAKLAPPQRFDAAWQCCDELCTQDIATNVAIGGYGSTLLKSLAQTSAAANNRPLNVMTHCNAGWLATVDWGTALAPIYLLHDAGQPIHVWVSETRPRNQGAALTAWELRAQGVPHTLVVDNACGYLMQRGDVDAVIVGADRVAANGDVANKVGTYLKALAAHANHVPFYVATPLSTIDFSLEEGVNSIPIENRDESEVTTLVGAHTCPEGTRAANPAFDVTPSTLVTRYITERGVFTAAELLQFRTDKHP